MGFLSGDHQRAWSGFGEARAATDLDRDGLMMDVEAAFSEGFDLEAVSQTEDGLLVELTWDEGGEATIEGLDAAIYRYVARLSYDDVMIARNVASGEVRYLVATATDDRMLGQMITFIVGGRQTEETLATYHQIRRELGGG